MEVSPGCFYLYVFYKNIIVVSKDVNVKRSNVFYKLYEVSDGKCHEATFHVDWSYVNKMYHLTWSEHSLDYYCITNLNL